MTNRQVGCSALFVGESSAVQRSPFPVPFFGQLGECFPASLTASQLRELAPARRTPAETTKLLAGACPLLPVLGAAETTAASALKTANKAWPNGAVSFALPADEFWHRAGLRDAKFNENQLNHGSIAVETVVSHERTSPNGLLPLATTSREQAHSYRR